MAHLNATVDNSNLNYSTNDPSNQISTVINDSNLNYTSTNLLNPTRISSLSDIANVDTAVLERGSVLVFNTNTNKWTSTLNLHEQDMEGGEF